MGEEAKQEEVKAAESPPLKREEKPADEEKKEEEKKEEAKPSPPPPIVLFVGLHCVGCAKKIQRSILKCRGVEAVETNIEKNEVIVRGAVDPQALCSRLRKKTSRNAKLLSPPLPPADAPDVNNSESKALSQVSGVTRLELLVNMHCEACAQQLRKKILKMRGVQSAETDLSAKKVIVIGSVNGDKLVEYIHRRTGKIAKIIPPSAPLMAEQKAEEEKKEEEGRKSCVEEKKEDHDALKQLSEGKQEEKAAGEGEAAGKEEGLIQAASGGNHEEMMKRMVYWNGAAGGYMMMNEGTEEDELGGNKRLMHHWLPMPMLMPASTVYPLQPPQLFSDENPNACCVS